MSLTYGFYNSLNHDRMYNAIQMSSIFDGVINDGIFMSIGDNFKVTASGNDMTVTVGTGRAWFNHTWTLNDALLPLTVPQSELVLNRYDAVILEVNSEQSVRANSIKIVKGTPGSNPGYPKLTNTSMVHQYVLAYIYVAAGVTTIRQANITSRIGKSGTPYVTGIIDTIDIEDMVAQWEDQWTVFFEKQETDMEDTNAKWKDAWREWFEKYVSDMNKSATQWNNLWDEWYQMYTDSSAGEFANWKNQQKAEFLEWFGNLKDMLTDQVEAMMAAEIEALKKRADALESFQTNLTNEQIIYDALMDSSKDIITDSNGRPIDAKTILATYENPRYYSVSFTSGDSLATSSSYDYIPLITSGMTLGDLMNVLSRIVKNGRWLYRHTFGGYGDYRTLLEDFSDLPVEIRKNTFRGKNLGTTFTVDQAQNIASGEFTDFFIGDYWKDGDITWRIVDMNYWIGTGDTACREPHLVVMPDNNLYQDVMNTTAVTNSAYVNSNMYKTGLNEAKQTIKRFFKNNILNHREYLSNAAVDGKVTNLAWFESTVELPNEAMMYGSFIYSLRDSTGGLRSTLDTTQLALMRLNPKWISPNRQTCWLRDISSNTNFVIASSNGLVTTLSAAESRGVRPVFGVIGGEI